MRASLHAAAGLAVLDITFLPLGHDASAWVYRARMADGGTYFVKVRQRVSNVAGLLVPRYLRDQGITQIVAPLPARASTPVLASSRTSADALWTLAGDYAMLLYPFIEGATGMACGLLEHQWIEYGALLRQVHDTAVPPDLAQHLARESFAPAGADLLRALDAQISARSFDHVDPAASALAPFWQSHRETIRLLLARAEDLGQRLAGTAPPLVLCHADIHTGNVLLDTAGRVWFVDWDETMLAPRERDLMFAVGGGISAKLVGTSEERLFLQGYHRGGR